MRSLALDEVGSVSGGDWMSDIRDATSFGAAAGSAIGYIATGTAAGAANGGLLGGAAMFSFSIGYLAGTILYNTIC